MLFTSFYCLAQKKKKEVVQYQAIPLANIEEAFPVAAKILNDEYRINITKLDWGKKEMLSGHYQYSKLLGPFRFKFFISIDEENLLNVEAKEVQTTSDDGWMDYVVEKREREIVAEFAEKLRIALDDAGLINEAKENFYTNLNINALFFITATEIAGERWFESFIKDRSVSWKLTFDDLKENKNSKYSFTYVENYTFSVEFVGGYKSNFNVIKYTNSDKNVLSRKGSTVIVDGTCVDLTYNNIFNITLVE